MPEIEFSKKREKELVEDAVALEEVIKNFWEILPIPTCTTSPIFIVLETGKSFDTLFGYDSYEITGEHLKTLFFNQDEGMLFLERIATEKRIFGFELALKTKKGEKIFALISAIARVDENGDILNFLFSFQDVTGRKAIEQKLEEKLEELQGYTLELENTRKALLNILEDVGEERSRAEEEKERTTAIIKNFVDGLILMENGKIALGNSKIKELFNVSDEEILGKEIKDIMKNSRMGDLAKLLKKSGMQLTRRELPFPDGRTLEVSTTSVIRKGEEAGKMIIVHDVTREKFIEKMKTEFVSIAAHQLRTPISAIKWILRMLLDGDLGMISQTQNEYIEKAYNSNERMVKLVNDLLNVTRIEEGRFLYDIQKENIVELAERAVASSSGIAKERGIEFIFNNLSNRAPKIYVDSNKITLAIQNLAENAINYTKAGKVIFTVYYSTKRKKFLFKMEDTGIGIPEDQQARVFSRFFRAGNAVKTETSGTGLGLFIAKNIIEAHRGRIWFKSSPKGTVFYFILPIKDKADLEKFIEGF